MGQQLAWTRGWTRRDFMRVAGVGTVGLVAAGCGDGDGDGDDPPTGEDGDLSQDLFEAPTGVLDELSGGVPPDQQGMTVEEFTAPAPDKYDPPIELTTVATTQPAVTYPEGDSESDNSWTRAYERKYGIKISVEWAVDATQVAERTNLMIASGDLPDFFVATQSQFDQLVQADLVEDLTDVYQEHASDRVRAVILESGPIPLQSAVHDGRLMAVPWSSNNPENSSVWVVRKDWLDKLGLPVPETMDDLLRTAEAFVTDDPGGNGPNNTRGIALDQNFFLIWGFLNGYHAYKEIWIERDGQLVYGSVQPEMKEALAQLQRMFQIGQIDPEFGTKDGLKVTEEIVSGRIGIWQGNGAFSIGAQLKQNDPEAELIAFPLVSVDDEPARPQSVSGANVRGYWVVRKGYEHPEAILKLLDFFIDAFYFTPSDEIYKVFNNDNELASPVWLLNRAAVFRAYKNIDVYRAVTELIDSPNPDLDSLRPELRSIHDQVTQYLDGDVTYYDWYLGFYGPTSGRAAEDVYRQENRYQHDQFYGEPTPTMSQRWESLLSEESETFTRIIQGGSIDDFDEFVASWQDIGGDQIAVEVNEWRDQQDEA